MKSKLIKIFHRKGQKYFGRTKWAQVFSLRKPVIDEENPDLSNDPKVKFYKPEKANK